MNLPPPRQRYSLELPAHKFKQGGRDAYYFVLDLETLDGMLPARVDDSVIADANRKLTPAHARHIQEYLREQCDWLLGSLMLGVAPDAVDFESLETLAESGVQFGILRIKANRVNTLKIFDGQHRRRAIQDLFTELTGQLNGGKVPDALRASSLPVLLYAESNLASLRQMFVDASQTKPIEPFTVARFDQRDAFNAAAVQLACQSRLLQGRVEMERSYVPRSSECVLAINQLAACLKVLEYGNSRQPSLKARRSMSSQERAVLYAKGRVWADEFLPACREEYAGLLNGTMPGKAVPALRGVSFVFNATWFRILAGCHMTWTQTNDSWDRLARFIRAAALEAAGSSGLLQDADMIKPDGSGIFAHKKDVDRAIAHIVQAARQA